MPQMSKEIIYDAVVTVAGTAISDHVKKVTIQMQAADVDVTSMGSTAMERRSGLRDDSFSLDVFQDFASSSIDQIFYPLLTSGTPVVVTVKKSSASTSATNPIYFGTCVVLTYNPLDVEVAQASMTTINLPSYSTGIVRGTA